MKKTTRPAPEEDGEDEADIPALARDYGERAVKIIATIMEKGGPFAPVRLRAAESLLNRGWGKVEGKRLREPRRLPPVGKIIRIIVDPKRDRNALKKAIREQEEVRKTESAG